jgi:glycosyltransferase involved in cell wall biosynthesis
VAEPILFVDHASALGGAEHSLLLLLAHLERQRWEPTLACRGGPLAIAAQRLGVPVCEVPLPRLRRSPGFALDVARGARSIAGIARETGAVLLHANTVRAACYTAPAARLARLPFIWHMRDFWLGEQAPARPAFDRLGKRLLAAGAARIVANSHAVARQLPPSPRLDVVYNGIDLSRFDPGQPGNSFRQKHGIPPGAPVAGVAGRLRPWKGQDRFLRVAARVAAALPEARFVVAGGDPFAVDDVYPQALQRLAAELGLAGRVTLTGHLDDVRPALAALDLFVHPGDPEPFGLVNVEAMAMGLPVVAFAHGALPEIVSPDTGVLAPPGDEEAMARAIVSLLGDGQRRRALASAGRRRVEEQFTIQQTAAAMEALFSAVSARPATPDGPPERRGMPR